MSRTTSQLRAAVATATMLLALLALTTPSAEAGTYRVTACFGPENNSWAAEGSDMVAAYSDCRPGGDGLIARNTGGPGRAPGFASGRMILRAPPGTRITAFNATVQAQSQAGWQAGLYGESGWIWCGGCLGTLGTWQPINLGGFSTNALSLLVICGDGYNGCRRDAIYGRMAISGASVELTDDWNPYLLIAGGTLTASGWRRRTETLALDLNDNTGIRETQVFIDGFQRLRHPRSCDYTRTTPCPAGGETVGIDTATVGDGQHQVTVRVSDASGNASETGFAVWVDNTAPGGPRGLVLRDGEGWRSRNAFSLTWSNPPQPGTAPIAGLEYEMCPAANQLDDKRGCVRSRPYGDNPTAIKDLEVPSPGAWRTSFWLRDAAGNEDARTATPPVLLRFDADSPQLAIRALDPQHPTRLRIAASDATSGVAQGQLEVRRQGEHSWRSLTTELEPGGFVAAIDDELLPDGTYDVRARAIDHAGNERSSDRFDTGQPARLTLPLRIKTFLLVGRKGRKRCRQVTLRNPDGHPVARRRCRYRLVSRPKLRYGAAARLHGRLWSAGSNPITDAEIEIFEQIDTPGAAWRRVGVARTSRTGRFAFRTPKGPARLLRFRYPGTKTVRPRTRDVHMRVRASTSLRVSDHRVVNGETVTFRGRIRSKPIPPSGKLVALQVFTRGRWRTFANTRANTQRRWAYRYRFDATRHRVRYRFRALLPREATYPYATGKSRRVHVIVRGL